MSLFTREDSPFYWIRFTVNAVRIRESTGVIATPENRDLAQEYHDKRKAEEWEATRARPGRLWQEAVVRYLIETKAKKSHDWDVTRLRYFNDSLAGKALDEITEELLLEAIEGKLAKDEGGARLPYQPNANRYLAAVGAVLNKAVEWEWLAKSPRIPSFAEQKKRIRWITEDEVHKLVAELRKNADHLADMAEFTLATGLRDANCRLLRWNQIDMTRKTAWVYGDQAKGKRDIGIPLNDDAMRILRRRQGQHDDYVFTFKGKPVAKCSTKAWDKAKQRAKIEDFRWHDLRHTWASWHVQKGTALAKLMELGGWRSYDMVLRYAHLATEHLKEDAERVERTRPALRVVK